MTGGGRLRSAWNELAGWIVRRQSRSPAPADPIAGTDDAAGARPHPDGRRQLYAIRYVTKSGRRRGRNGESGAYDKPLRNVINDRAMSRGRKPLGDKAMTVAERQARFRGAHAACAPRVRYRRPADRRSRPQRWREAVAELVELQGEYRDWLDTLPPSLENSATAEALRAICDLDLSELESVEPPRGFGRD